MKIECYLDDLNKSLKTVKVTTPESQSSLSDGFDAAVKMILAVKEKSKI